MSKIPYRAVPNRSMALCAGLVLCAVASGTGRAQEIPPVEPPVNPDPVLYGLSETGLVSVNGLTVRRLRTAAPYVLDAEDEFWTVLFPGGSYVADGARVDVADPSDYWSSLAAEERDPQGTDPAGSDRWALRRDGVLRMNDLLVGRLPWEGTGNWHDLAVVAGSTYAIRSDGAFAVDGLVAATFPTDGMSFRRIVHDGVHSYSLRSDGTVFRDAETTAFFEFRGGRGTQGDLDGRAVPTTWIALARDPSAAFLYALRADGVVFRGSLSAAGPRPIDGEVVATLPYDALAGPLLDQVFVDFVFVAGGEWLALAGDGRLYAPLDPLVPVADLPGGFAESSQVFVDLAAEGGLWFALRSDGGVWAEGADGSARQFGDLGGISYGSIAVARGTPVLPAGLAAAPRPTLLVTRSVVGNPLRVPVVVADVDTDAASVVVTPIDPVPAGAVWDAATSTLVWDAPAPAGRNLFRFQVTDGVSTETHTQVILLRDPDASLRANRAPLVPTVRAAVARVGVPYVLPLVVDDRDGDTLTVTVDTTAYPFTAGATYDDVTRTFSWTPAWEDQGKVVVTFRVRDGASRSVVRLPLRVRAGFGL